MNSLSDIKQQSTQLNEGLQNLRDYINEVAIKSAENGVPETVDEGLIGALVGGLVGSTAGKTIMQAVCRALGINEKSALGQLLTSRMVLTAVGIQLGYKW